VFLLAALLGVINDDDVDDVDDDDDDDYQLCVRIRSGIFFIPHTLTVKDFER